MEKNREERNQKSSTYGNATKGTTKEAEGN